MLSAELSNDLPENHGLSSKALLNFMAHIDRLNLQVNSLMLLQEGQVTAEFWRRPYRKDCPQLLYSLSKSFTSIAIGIAWDNGYLDLQDKVVSFFPNHLPANIPTNLSHMTVHHLLSMNTGHQENIYSTVASETDWVRTFLSLEVEHEPGSYYRYSTHAAYMLAAIVEQVTGQNLVEFLMPRLFEPLGIARPIWETCPMGTAAGGMGLSLSTEGIAKFGQMLLDKGMYKGRRIVSERYIELASQEQSDNRQEADRIDSAQGYGYQFFLCRRGCFMGNGSFGQLCFVAPNERIVIAATSSFTSMKQLQTLLDLIYEHIIDRLHKDSHSLSLDDYYELQRCLANLPSSVPIPPYIEGDLPNIDGNCYIMDENTEHLQQLQLVRARDLLEVIFLYEDKPAQKFRFDFAKPVYTRARFVKDLAVHEQEVVTYVIWQDKGSLKLTMNYIETPYVATYKIMFKPQTIELQFDINVSLTLKPYTITGTLIENGKHSPPINKGASQDALK